MKITKRQLRRIIKEEISRITEGEVIDFPDPSLPSEFGPEGYLMKDPRLRKMMSSLEYGSDSRPEELIAIALSARAVVLLDPDGEKSDIEVTVKPDIFLKPYIDVAGHGQQVPPLADHIYKGYVIGMAGDRAQNLDSIITRIVIDYFDEDIENVVGAAQMQTTQSMAAQQDPQAVEEMGTDFDRFLQGVDPVDDDTDDPED